MYAMKRMNNDMAVSPIVATLILIVVAVIGAVAVGTIMGTFSSSVSGQVNTDSAAAATATSGNILIAGSTTVEPASLLLATDYMTQNPGIHITVQGGGSGAGVSAVGQNIVDIGASSSALSAAQMTEYPNLNAYTIGGRAVVWIVNKANTLYGTGAVAGFPSTTVWVQADSLQPTDIKSFVSAAPGTHLKAQGTVDTGITTLIQRADASGTESTASQWSTYTSSSNDNAFDNVPCTNKAETGNTGVLAEVQGDSTGTEIGFVDLGYVLSTAGALQSGASNVVIVPADDANNVLDSVQAAQMTGSTFRADALQGCKDKFSAVTQVTTADYPQGLTSGLYYVTNGAATGIDLAFIHYAQSPSGGADVQAAGDFALSEVKV